MSSSRPLFLAVLACAALPAHAAPPRFEDYREAARPVPAAVEPKLRTEADRLYRTRIREAAKQPVNFGGHYVLTTFGCGTQCMTLFVVDKATGDVAWLEPTYGCDGTDEPLAFRRDSRLLVVTGGLDSCDEKGTFWYAVKGRRIVEVARVERPRSP